LAVRLIAVAFLLASSAAGKERSRVDAGVFAPLHAPTRPGARVRIADLPLVERRAAITLEEFSVLAPGAFVEVFDGDDKPHRVQPQPIRQFRGTVAGDPQSLVYLSMSPGKGLSGIIVSRERKFSLWSGGRAGADRKDVFVEEITEAAMADVGDGFRCDVENLPLSSLSSRSAATGLDVKPNAAPTGTQKTVLNLAVESDSALYLNFGGDIANVETYLRNLVGAASTIYSRDLNTEIRISYLGLHTTTDPFTINPGTAGTWNGNAVTYTTTHALLEFGDRWHNDAPSAAPRSAAALISGQSQRAGVAWIQSTCSADFLCQNGNCGSATYNGHYGGGYSYNGGVGLTSMERNVPDPDANANFGAPGSGYWPLLQLAHEFGHNVQSRHTHCVTLDAPDQTTYGRTFVDNCFSGDGGCYAGPASLPADGAGGRGTIMSYCHLRTGAGNNTRYTFGQANEASHKIVDLMRGHLDIITPAGLSAITALSSVPAGVAGQAASVANNAGLSFEWTITNGLFSNGQTTITGASVTFAGNANPVTLNVVATNASGCSVSDSKSVTVTGVAAPANVAATASSASAVTVTWDPSGSATSYNVYRSTDGTNFTLAGSPVAPPFVDTNRSANTAYLYKVRGVNDDESADSNKDYAVTIAFTDTTITAQSTPIKAVHLTELRTAVNALRALNAGQAAFTFTDGVVQSTACKAVHMTELRTVLNTVRTALGFPALTFTDAAVSTSTNIKKVHIDELRAGVR
jgi:hypothetical protein